MHHIKKIACLMLISVLAISCIGSVQATGYQKYVEFTCDDNDLVKIMFS
ncbi:MAG: hypothetical protein LBR15_09645 [Methanobrevibacter sp.]|nr:hypothetical protein [Candidatus Methanovirga australis]